MVISGRLYEKSSRPYIRTGEALAIVSRKTGLLRLEYHTSDLVQIG